MYVLKLHKLNSNAKEEKDLVNGSACLHTFGFFDKLSVDEVPSIRQVLTSGGEYSQSPDFRQYLIPAFRLSEQDHNKNRGVLDYLSKFGGKVDQKAEREQKLLSENLFLFTFLQIHKEVFHKSPAHMKSMPDKFESVGIAFLRYVEEAMRESLNEISEKNKSWTVNLKGIEVYGLLGTLDLLVTYQAKNIKELLLLPQVIRTTMCSVKTDHEMTHCPLFDYSNSFIAHSTDILPEKLDNMDSIEIAVRLSGYQSSGEKMMKDTVKDHLETRISDGRYTKVKHETFCLLGDDDFQVKMTANTKDFMQLIVNGLFSVHYTKSSSETAQFRRINTVFMTKLDDIPNLPIGSGAVKPVETPGADATVVQLGKLWNKAYTYIPPQSRLTMRRIISACQYFLNNEFNRLTGMKVSAIIEQALMRIARKPIPSGDTINNFVHAISYIIPTSIRSESIFMESMELNDLVSPISKIVFSYEHIIRKVFEHAHRNVEESELYPFITIGRGEDISIDNFFLSHERALHNIDNKKYSRITCINFPSLEYLPIQTAFIPLLHEISHQTQVERNRTGRNNAFREFCLNYVLVRIQLEMEEIGYELLDFAGLAAVFRNCLEKLHKHRNIYSLMPTMALDDYAKELSEEFKLMANERRIAEIPQNHPYSDYMMDCMNGLLAHEVLKLLDDLFREIHADILSLEMIQAKTIEYFLDAQYNMFCESGDKESINEDFFLLRMTAAISFHIQRTAKREDKIATQRFVESELEIYCSSYERIDSNRASVLAGFYRFASEQYELVQPIVHYYLTIFGEKKNSDKQSISLTKENFGIDPQRILSSELSENEELAFFIDAWYHSILDLEEAVHGSQKM